MQMNNAISSREFSKIAQATSSQETFLIFLLGRNHREIADLFKTFSKEL